MSGRRGWKGFPCAGMPQKAQEWPVVGWVPLTDREPAFRLGIFTALALSSVKFWQWFSNEEIGTADAIG